MRSSRAVYVRGTPMTTPTIVNRFTHPVTYATATQDFLAARALSPAHLHAVHS